jgi:hypothetical protein
MVVSFILRGVDIYQTHHSISAAAAAYLVFGVLALVIGTATFFRAVLSRK